MFSFLKRPMINAEGQKRVAAAIKEAESKTSGEVRVYMEHKCEGGRPAGTSQTGICQAADGKDRSTKRRAYICSFHRQEVCTLRRYGYL